MPNCPRCKQWIKTEAGLLKHEGTKNCRERALRRGEELSSDSDSEREQSTSSSSDSDEDREPTAEETPFNELAPFDDDAGPMDIDPSANAQDFDPPPPPVEKQKSAWIDDEGDDSDTEDEVYVEEFDADRGAGAEHGKAKTSFEEYRETQRKAGVAPFFPYADMDEWDVVRWLMESGTSQGKKDEFLRLKKVSIRKHPQAKY
jgi:hypothetical protein